MESSIEVQSHNFALITLKERCHFLKQQLKAVDDENVKLKVQIASGSVPKENKSLQHKLTEEIELLRKQKEQLSNQIHILATENNNMWSRLSKLTALNKNLSQKFSNISDTLLKYGINSSLGDESKNSNSALESEDCRKTLEEMSLRLINGIKLEKTELEKQYAQMVDLHRADITGIGQDLAFSSIDGDEDTVMAGVRKHSQKLNQLKSALEQQQACLLVSLKELQKFKNETKSANKVNNSVQTEATTEPVVHETVRAVPITATVEVSNSAPALAVNDEQKCPMCAMIIQGNMQTFIDHVSEHFDNTEENDQNSFIHLA